MRYSKYWYAAHAVGIPTNVVDNMFKVTVTDRDTYCRLAIRQELKIRAGLKWL